MARSAAGRFSARAARRASRRPSDAGATAGQLGSRRCLRLGEQQRAVIDGGSAVVGAGGLDDVEDGVVKAEGLELGGSVRFRWLEGRGEWV